MEEQKPDVTSDKPAPKVKRNTTAKKVVGIVFIIMGVIGTVALIPSLIHYNYIANASYETLGKEYPGTVCVSYLKYGAEDSLEVSLNILFLMIVLLLFGLFLVFLTYRIKAYKVIIFLIIFIIIFMIVTVFTRNRLGLRECSTGVGTVSATTIVPQLNNLTLHKWQ